MQRLTPLVNLFEAAVNKVHRPEEVPAGSSPAEAPKFQYQRAYAISKGLSDQLYTYSTEQVNQLKAQSVLVQKAADAAHKVSEVASTSYGAAQDRVHGLSDTMVQELQKVQVRDAYIFHPAPLLIFDRRLPLLTFPKPSKAPSMTLHPNSPRPFRTSLPFSTTLRPLSVKRFNRFGTP